MSPVISKDEQQYQEIFESASDGVMVIDFKTNKVLAANTAAARMHGYEREEFCGLNWQNLILAKNLNSFLDFSDVILNGGVFDAVVQHIRIDSSLLNVEWRAVAYVYKGHKCALATLRDVSKRIKAEQHLKSRLLEKVREQATLLEISQVLTSSLDLKSGLILDQIKVMVKYSHACRFRVDDSNLLIVSSRGIDGLNNLMPLHIPFSGNPSLETMVEEHTPVRISDIWSDDPHAKFLRKLLVNDSAILLKDVKSWMWVPLINKGQINSVIGLARTDEKDFSKHEAEIAMTIANMAAVALVNADLYEHAQALAALQERQRLAQNLHDAVNQSLFSAGLIAEVLPRLWEIDLNETRRSLEDLRRLIRGAMAEMRALLAELRPTTLTDSELGELLLLLGNAFTGRTNIPVDVTVTGEGKLPAETQVALYRICQEGLNNIAKHAKASQVEIEMHHTPLGSVLNIRDNGRGFDTNNIISFDHYGLNMMKERAEMVGAKLLISSQLDHGTEISICWGEEEK